MPSLTFKPYKRSIAIDRSLELSLLGIPIAFVLICITIRLLSKDFYVQFVEEDGPIELATSLAYFLAFLVTVPITLKFHRRQHRIFALLYGLLGLGFLFVSGEEISWGQRYIGFQSPEFFGTYNLQSEVTLHNLVHGQIVHIVYAVISFYGVFARFLVPRSIRAAMSSGLDYFIPGRSLMTFFLIPLVYFSIPLSIIWTRPLYGYLTYREQEPSEFLLSLGFLSFVILARYRQSKDVS